MKISQAMTRDVHTAAPDASVKDAARTMVEADVGLLPVQENDRLIGMITDRDIAVRAIGEGMGPETPIREVMTSDVRYCFDDDEIDDVCRNMADNQVRRLPVINREKRLVGIVSLADLASNGNAKMAGQALHGITQPGGARSQSLDGATA